MVINIITVCLNAKEGIKRSLSSISLQKIDCKLNHIIIDGGSSDGTLDVIKKNGLGISTIVSEPDKGIYEALNKAIPFLIEGVVGILHAGDEFSHDGVLNRVVKMFNEDGNLMWLYGGVRFMGNKSNNKRVWIPGKLKPWKIYLGYMPPHPAVFFKSSVFKKIGGFNIDFAISGDYDWLLRLIKTGEKNQRIKEVLIEMEPGGASSNTISNLVVKGKEDCRAISENLRVNRAVAAVIWGFKIINKVPQMIFKK